MKEEQGLKGFKELLFETILPKIEMISLILIAVSILFKILHLQGTVELLMISLTTYAITCYLAGFEKTELTSWLDQLILKVGAISSAIVVIGLLFLLLQLSGAYQMLIIGTPIFAIALILVLVKFLNSESEVFKKVLIKHVKTVAVVSIVYLVMLYLNS